MKKNLILFFMGLFGIATAHAAVAPATTTTESLDRSRQEIDALVYNAQDQSFEDFKCNFIIKFSQLTSELLQIGSIDLDTTDLIMLVCTGKLFAPEFSSHTKKLLDTINLSLTQNNTPKLSNMLITFILYIFSSIPNNEITLRMKYLIFSRHINTPADIPAEYVQQLLGAAYAGTPEPVFRDLTLFPLIQRLTQICESFYTHLKQHPVLDEEYSNLKNGSAPLASNELVKFLLMEIFNTYFNAYIITIQSLIPNAENARAIIDNFTNIKNKFLMSHSEQLIGISKWPLSILIRIFGDIRYLLV